MSDESMVTFEEWMAELDATVRSRAGIALVDLPPRHWRDYYDDGVSAEDSFDYYVRDALEELGLHLEIADAFDAADELGFDARDDSRPGSRSPDPFTVERTPP